MSIFRDAKVIEARGYPKPSHFSVNTIEQSQNKLLEATWRKREFYGLWITRILLASWSLPCCLCYCWFWFVDIKNPISKLNVPQLILLSAEVSSNFLSNLEGVFLTVTTFSFTTILTVVTTYSSSFSPRVVQKFIDKPKVLSLFGIFVGGFFY